MGTQFVGLRLSLRCPHLILHTFNKRGGAPYIDFRQKSTESRDCLALADVCDLLSTLLVLINSPTHWLGVQQGCGEQKSKRGGCAPHFKHYRRLANCRGTWSMHSTLLCAFSFNRCKRLLFASQRSQTDTADSLQGPFRCHWATQAGAYTVQNCIMLSSRTVHLG